MSSHKSLQYSSLLPEVQVLDESDRYEQNDENIGDRAACKISHCSLNSSILGPSVKVNEIPESDGFGLYWQSLGSGKSCNIETRLYKRRWIILFLYCMVTMSNACIWLSLSSISNLVESFFNIAAIWVSWLSMSFFVTSIVMAVPASLLSGRFGLKLAMVLPAAFHAIGTAVRVIGCYKHDFSFIAAGQFIAACGTIFVLAAPPLMAALWFGDNERTTATATGMVFNFLGVSLGFLLSSYTVPDATDMAKVGVGLLNLLISQAVFCAIIFLLVVFFVKDMPPTPPSIAQALRDPAVVGVYQPLPLTKSLKNLFCDMDYLLIVASYTLNFCISGTFPTLINQLVSIEGSREHYIIPNRDIGWIGFTGPLASVLVTLFVGLIIDKYKCYKLSTCTLLFLMAVSVTALGQLLMRVSSEDGIGAGYVLVVVFSFPYFAYGLDHIAEISYPIAESISTTVPLIIANCFSLATILCLQVTLDHGNINVVLYILNGFAVLAFILSLLAKTKLKRQFKS